MEEGSRAGKEKMVETEVEDGSKGLAERDECSADTNDSSRKDIIPIVDYQNKVRFRCLFEIDDARLTFIDG